MVTDPRQAVEFKGRDVFEVENCKRLIFTSNERWAVPRDLDDRRFLVLDAPDCKRRDYRFFAALHEQMAVQANLNELHHALLAEDISSFNVRALPTEHGDDGADIRRKSFSPVAQFWHECLLDGAIPGIAEGEGIMEPGAGWHISVSKSRLFDVFHAWADRQRLLHRPDRPEFDAALQAACPLLETHRPGSGNSRERVWRVPMLFAARKIFAESTGIAENVLFPPDMLETPALRLAEEAA